MNIGIWGLGRVGRSAVRYFASQNHTVTVLHNSPLSDKDAEFVKDHNANFVLQTPESIEQVFTQSDRVLVSPGIDVRPYAQFHHKLITELDIFAAHCTAPVVGITGSLGKTTITTVLQRLLNDAGVTTCAAGNIGTPLLDVMHSPADLFVCELSSFQLEHTTTFAPDLAVWTNLYPNHLDRHTTLDDYFEAKWHIIAYQQPHQRSIVPVELIPLFEQRNRIRTGMHFVSVEQPHEAIITRYASHTFFWLTHNGIVVHHNGITECIVPAQNIPRSSFVYNWIILAATLHLLGYDPRTIAHCPPTLLEHRLEYVTTHNDVEYYNDSKSTIGQATIAAVQNFSNKSVIVLCGGLSKGVDRMPIIQQLKQHVTQIICFGAESAHLAHMCTQERIPTYACATLQQACDYARTHAHNGDVVILSPGGSSFDLFDNYEHRGHVFKEYIKTTSVVTTHTS